jgi:hypothetical protein
MKALLSKGKWGYGVLKGLVQEKDLDSQYVGLIDF